MRTALLLVLLLVATGVGAYYAFPWWYLNNSKHVILQPSALSTTSPPTEMEENPQKPDEQPSAHPIVASDILQVMYFDEKAETRIASGLQQMDLPLPVVRIGVGLQGDFQVAGLEVWMGQQPSRARFERECLDVVYTTWRMAPQLSEVDIWGVDQPDTKQRRGREVFSLMVQRPAFVAADPRLPRDQQVKQLGLMWCAPSIP